MQMWRIHSTEIMFFRNIPRKDMISCGVSHHHCHLRWYEWKYFHFTSVKIKVPILSFKVNILQIWILHLWKSAHTFKRQSHLFPIFTIQFQFHFRVIMRFSHHFPEWPGSYLYAAKCIYINIAWNIVRFLYKLNFSSIFSSKLYVSFSGSSWILFISLIDRNSKKSRDVWYIILTFLINMWRFLKYQVVLL